MCDVWETKVMILKPNCCVCSIDFKVTCEYAHLELINDMIFKNPLGTNLLKKDMNFLNRKHF